MNKNEFLKIIKNFQWQKFLTRPYGLSFVHIHARAYHQILKHLTGPNFQTLYVARNGLVDIYRDKESAETIKNNFYKLTANKQQLTTIAKTIFYHQQKINNTNELYFSNINHCAQYFAYLTALPFNIGNTIVEQNLHLTNNDHDKILIFLKKIRGLNYYHKFGQHTRTNNKEFIYLIINNRAFFSFHPLIIKNVVASITIPTNKVDSRILTGKTAFPGVVTGQVIIINEVSDMIKFSAGKILVSHSTNPELLPIMRLAKAIITDEGGIMSHASILARELKIPCVIGTVNATSILKDRDIVEVDANKGIIKKIFN